MILCLATGNCLKLWMSDVDYFFNDVLMSFIIFSLSNCVRNPFATLKVSSSLFLKSDVFISTSQFSVHTILVINWELLCIIESATAVFMRICQLEIYRWACDEINITCFLALRICVTWNKCPFHLTPTNPTLWYIV